VGFSDNTHNYSIRNDFTACNTNDYEQKDNELFTGWETEKADNENFYLVFITKQNKKRYFVQYDGCITEMKSKKYATKFIYNNEKTKIISSIYHDYLTFVPCHSYLSLHEGTNEMLNSVCLTESINNHYVLK
jgi:hypothetical protein